ncbi:YdeI/OmpD-associated family protein [Pelagovum pacificum]|uniref:YdhG-like domain-containing protein n=1 Tax=Pelagovum pacificum TaxID=2588711 RepID=A0A5C5GBE1_9RHOB|nr:YdeI/OmpD-associated family protein [Pelagovum pacificum]QQA41628.1 YdeI/OmpD-associated family protein [Pelagovum pacificum]TNY30907.1 hypothetical protein FHY64_17530 [Pelagovum pacificum]
MARTADEIFAEAELWHEEAIALRARLLETGLTEEVKWRQACYTSGGHNICIIQRMQGFLSLMFFRGALMKDPEGVLKSQGENSRSVLRIEFTSLAEIEAAEYLAAYVAEAVRVAEAGLKVARPEEPDYPDELVEALDSDAELAEAFAALTPGRRRYYVIHFSEPKKSETRVARIEKLRGKILAGKGVNER